MALTACACWERSIGRPSASCVFKLLQGDGAWRDLLRTRHERPRRRSAAEEGVELAAPNHVWMAPAWQEIIWRAVQRSLAVMCPASHDGFSVKG
jgi:hypothetical protein